MRKIFSFFKNIWILWEREFRSYFYSPMAYIVMGFFLAMCGFFFNLSIEQTREASLRPVLSPIAFLSMMIIPLISMRLFAEEQKNGTLELLLTAPVTTLEVVIAKYLGAFFFYLSLLLPTLLYFLVFWHYKGPVDFYPTFTFYLGLALLAGTYISIGMFISTLTSNQIIASFVTFVILLLVYLLFTVEQNMPDKIVGKVAGYFAWSSHLDSFQKGILDSKDILYFLHTSFVFVLFTVLSIDWKREA